MGLADGELRGWVSERFSYTSLNGFIRTPWARDQE